MAEPARLNPPDEVVDRRGESPRATEKDPTLGITVTVDRAGPEPHHRLVTIGDSLTHGFQSGAVFNTDVSYPAVIAHELGLGDQFRYPTYPGYGGLPLNIELLLRELEERFGQELDWWEVPLALFHARRFLDEAEDYWERGPGSRDNQFAAINHNLAVYGWDLRDVLSKNATVCRVKEPRDNLLHQVAQDSGNRAALRVLPPASIDGPGTMTLLDAAQHLGDEEAPDQKRGIETLIVFLGANNALQTVTQLKVQWSGEEYRNLKAKEDFTVWDPSHFRDELAEIIDEVAKIRARHVIWCTVPHVTIPPIARGVGNKPQDSRYFPYYTRPWISDLEFSPTRHPHLTAEQAQDIDTAIDLYNEAITDHVAKKREAEGLDWLLMDTAGLLDRLASRRYMEGEDPSNRPEWWEPYPLPAQLDALTPKPNSHFLTSNGKGRTDGGLFSLDGVHPSTIGYGILAQEMINVMRRCGVEFRHPVSGNVRPDPVVVDFDRLLRRDTLIHRPPGNLTSGLNILAWGQARLDLVKRALYFR
ncbi:hypothetical protein OG787_21370 [Streptomyces sp. NBC_00075]|uniref:hypothetical protein n=1 Tax=Streptomyces sp. NBC_00075 TaxID=2975641 RepID=UPI00324EE7FD